MKGRERGRDGDWRACPVCEGVRRCVCGVCGGRGEVEVTCARGGRGGVVVWMEATHSAQSVRKRTLAENAAEKKASGRPGCPRRPAGTSHPPTSGIKDTRPTPEDRVGGWVGPAGP
jgi:hypothetical protein